MYPEFIKRLPRVDLHIEGLIIFLLRGEQSVALIEVERDLTFPMHKHGAQWGVVLAGEIALTINDQTTTYQRGDTYYVPAQSPHGADLKKGSRLLEFYEEADRFPR